MRIKRTTYFLYWVFTIGLIIFLQFFWGNTVAINTTVPSTHSSDGALSNVQFYFFSPQGERLYYLESDTLSYFTERENMHLEPLKVVYTTPDDVQITLTSEVGRVLSDGAVVELEGNVHINKFVSESGVKQEAETDYLYVDTTKQIASTEKPAVIQWGNRIFSGTGMEIDLNNGKMRLLENVKVSNVGQ